MLNFQTALAVFLSLPTLASPVPQSLVQAMTSQQLVERGREAFLNRCSGCHGVTAEGNGPASAMLNPRPRNLVTGSFKFRSTAPGVLPTTQDLIRTIDHGIPGSSMPSFRELSEWQKLALATYIRSLRPEFSDSRADQQPLAWPSPPKEIFSNKKALLAAAKQGKALYTQGCVSCHGPEGLGDGPAAADLTDSENFPIKPANLTRRQIKTGSTVRDLFRAVSLGMEGSPMPAFQDMFTEKQRWDLVAYLFYLRGVGAQTYTKEDLQ